jgi:hypothetical protein
MKRVFEASAKNDCPLAFIDAVADGVTPSDVRGAHAPLASDSERVAPRFRWTLSAGPAAPPAYATEPNR